MHDDDVVIVRQLYNVVVLNPPKFKEPYRFDFDCFILININRGASILFAIQKNSFLVWLEN